jgi:hypothetical protein
MLSLPLRRRRDLHNDDSEICLVIPLGHIYQLYKDVLVRKNKPSDAPDKATDFQSQKNRLASAASVLSGLETARLVATRIAVGHTFATGALIRSDPELTMAINHGGQKPRRIFVLTNRHVVEDAIDRRSSALQVKSVFAGPACLLD